MNTNNTTPQQVTETLNRIVSDPYRKGQAQTLASIYCPDELKACLIDTLATNGVPVAAKERFYIDQTPTKIYTPVIENKVHKAKVHQDSPLSDVVKTLSVCCSSDTLRPTLQYIKADKITGKFYATDAHKLIIFEHEAAKTVDHEATMINPKTGEQVTEDSVGRYPNCEAVMYGDRETIEAEVDLNKLLNTCKAAIKASKVFKDDLSIIIGIELPTSETWYGNPKLIFDTVSTLLSLGHCKAWTRFATCTSLMQFECKQYGLSATACVMPVMYSEESDVKKIMFEVI